MPCRATNKWGKPVPAAAPVPEALPTAATTANAPDKEKRQAQVQMQETLDKLQAQVAALELASKFESS